MIIHLKKYFQNQKLQVLLNNLFKKNSKLISCTNIFIVVGLSVIY
jgi:hypothetical protein